MTTLNGNMKITLVFAFTLLFHYLVNGNITEIDNLNFLQDLSARRVQSELYHELETDRNQGLKMLSALSRAQLLNLLSAKSQTLKSMSKPDKIYCDNPNIMAALVERPDKGCMRETSCGLQDMK